MSFVGFNFQNRGGILALDIDLDLDVDVDVDVKVGGILGGEGM